MLRSRAGSSDLAAAFWSVVPSQALRLIPRVRAFSPCRKATSDGDVQVAQSRIMTEQGGNIVMLTSNGNLDAGKGAKTTVVYTPPRRGDAADDA